MAGSEELTHWLEVRGLAACCQPLIDNAVDLDLLPDLTDKDLASIGLVLGLRRRLMKAAAELRTPLATPAPAPTAQPPATPPIVLDGERRHMVVMFCDLVDITGTVEKLDGEDRLELTSAFLKTVSDAVMRFGGHVAKTMGDGLMAYFGYPEAEENDAERALHAGIAINDAVAALAARMTAARRASLAARVGLHAGLVVVADGADAFGDVPNIASRVQHAAMPGQTMISGAVHRAVAGLFVVEDKGPHALKGVPVPMTLFRVVRAASPRRRLRSSQAPTPLVGRDEQMAQIAARWQRTLAGQGQLVVLVSDPGLGKTRLIEAFQAGLADTPHTFVEWTCAQLLQNTAFNPLIEWARYRFGGAETETGQRLAALETALAAVGLDVAAAVPVLAPLFDIALDGSRFRPLAASAENLRLRQIATLVEWVLAAAREQPVMVMLEDGHWADPSTLEIVRTLVECNDAARVLVAVTARPEFRTPWPTRAHHTHITLSPLARPEVQRMLETLTANRALGPELEEIIARRTGGVPLFIEEVTRLLIQTEGRAGPRAIPSSLAASLTARLDHLGPGKKVAQIGAMLGRAFDWRLLRAVSGMDEAQLAEGLAKLDSANLLQADGVPPHAVYRFKNALLQDAARDGLLRPQWRELHKRTAEIMVRDFPEIVAAQPELLAHHLTEAGEPEAAIAAWEKASADATQRRAYAEGSANMRRALEVLTALPDAGQRTAREFELRTQLAECYWVSKTQSAPETIAAFEEALAVGERLGDSKALAVILSGLASAATLRADFPAAMGFADRLAALARRSGGAFERGWAGFRRAQVHMHRGNLAEARRLIDEASILAKGEDRLVNGGVQLIGAIGLYSPWLAVLMGDLDDARAEIGERLGEFADHGGPHNATFLLLGAANLHRLLGEYAEIEKYARLLLASGTQFRLPFAEAYGLLLLGAAATGLGRGAEGVDHLARGIELVEKTGGRSTLNLFSALLAEAQAEAGDTDAALVTVEQAVAQNELSPFMAPEVLRIKGAILLGRGQEGDESAAEAVFTEALVAARRMGAQLFTLQTATLLARRLAARNPTAARTLLAPVYATFRQGLDTKWPREARALLEQLG